ncbi:MAG: sugar-binding transcriptional regulator [Firmicutes bacterium]|jgi:DNA-binding transcriptional regulator LsrR (DeoR family)|nr:sugar-binding transcriptional regulator [Bacillota bacterium]
MEDKDLLVQVSWLYYRQGLTQEQISKKLGFSRVKVQRLLVRARNEGIVEIKINFPFEVCLELRQRLETLYGLRQAAVVPAAWTDEDLENALGEVGAEMLSRFMADAASVGVGWGVTVSAVVRHYPAQPVAGSLVVGLLGGQPQLSGVNPGEIAKGLSRKLGGECYTVPAPCFVNSKETRTILLGQPSIRQTLELAERVDLALVGVGTTMHNATLVKAGFLSPSEMAQLRAMGAVGDILGHFFDDQGRIIESEFEDRVISLELERLRRIPTVLCVAGGTEKVRAIHAALKTGAIDALVTDEHVARELVALAADQDTARVNR